MTKPKLLMMDEPSLGLAPIIVKMIFDIVRAIRQEGVTVLLIEQNAKAALEIADYGYVLETGRITLHGPGKQLLEDDRVRRAYLGEGH
jgi:branched-chain amino acid transport system ATP-binding protein